MPIVDISLGGGFKVDYYLYINILIISSINTFLARKTA